MNTTFHPAVARTRSARLVWSSGIIAIATLTVAAHADPVGTWEWTWVHVEPGSTNEITPQVPGKVSPGEAVEFRGTFSFTGMGTVQTSLSTGLSGPIVGLGAASFKFIAGANHGGAFYLPITRDPAMPGPPPQIMNGWIRTVGIGQLVVNGAPLAHTGTLFTNAVKIRWNPLSYDERVVLFEPQRELGPPQWFTGVVATMLIDPVEVLYAFYDIPIVNFGSVEVPIIPSPSGLAIVALAGLLAARRRREASAA